MSTTVVGVFSSRQQAEDAIYALRNQLESQNVAIIVRNEETGTNQLSNGMAANVMASGMSTGSTSGGVNTMPTTLMGELTQDAMQLGGTAGQLVGRVAALAATATFTLPAAMMGPMIQGMLGPTMPGTSPMSGAVQAAAPWGMGISGSSQASVSQTGADSVVITIHANENLTHAVDILRNHGAREVNTYSA